MLDTGIGSTMINMLKDSLRRLGVTSIFIDCHQENLASRGMREKPEFEPGDSFPDPERQLVGSRQTCGCQFSFSRGV